MAIREDLFLEVLKQLNGGRTLKELSEQTNQLVQSCRATGKKGELALKITFTPDKGDNGQYFLTDDVKVKAPIFERGKTLMWGTPDGNLQRTDPNQGELELRVVSEQPKDPKFVDEPAQPVKRVN